MGVRVSWGGGGGGGHRPLGSGLPPPPLNWCPSGQRTMQLVLRKFNFQVKWDAQYLYTVILLGSLFHKSAQIA